MKVKKPFSEDKALKPMGIHWKGGHHSAAR